MTRPKSERVELSMEALQAILEQARTAPLCEAHYQQLKGVLNTLGRLTRELENKRTSIHRLRNLLFGPQSEKTADVLKENKRQKDNDTAQAGTRGKGQQRKRKGHGRNAAQTYTGAQRVAVAHASLKPGDACPQSGCTGKV
jgi:transposase